MRVAVVGAGITGVTTTYELAASGLDVTVFERRNSVAAEASFAHAGVLAAGHLAPSAASGMPGRMLRHLLRRHAVVRFGGWNALSQLPWLWRGWRACRPPGHARHHAALQGLARFSCERLLELTRSLRLDYQQTPGLLVLLRSERDLARAQRGLASLRHAAVVHEVVDPARCRQIEPGLNPETALVAAIHLPQDGVGNCRHFAHLLKTEALRLGARFRFDTDVRSLTPGTTPSLTTADDQRHDFDAVVLCTGAQAHGLLASIGVKLPLATIHGYSVTAPLRHVDGHPPPGPRAALMDERFQVAITRLGQRIRIAGIDEIGGRLDRLDPAPLRTLYRLLDDWFPGAAVTRDAQHWKGARPMLPDGLPVLGASDAPGIWLNLGHGAGGWALACGSAQVLAESVRGREPSLDLGALTAARLR